MPTREVLSKNFWTRLRALRKHVPAIMAEVKQELHRHCTDRWVSGAVVSAKSLAHEITLMAILELDRDGQDPWPGIQESFALLYWMNEIDIHDFVKTDASYGVGDSQIYARCFLHSMALQTGADDMADWLAPFMLNVLRHGGGFAEDKAFAHFYALLLEAQITDRWIPDEAMTPDLSPTVVQLLRALPHPAELPSALIAYADWRLARANGYPEVSSVKKSGRYVFSEAWWGVFPFELFAVQAIFRRCTGLSTSLSAPHPLLETALMQAPRPVLPLIETTEVAMLRDFVSRVFGAEWQPMVPVARLPVG